MHIIIDNDALMNDILLKNNIKKWKEDLIMTVNINGIDFKCTIDYIPEENSNKWTTAYVEKMLPSTKEIQDKVGLIDFKTSLRMKAGLNSKSTQTSLNKLKKEKIEIDDIIGAYLMKINKAINESRDTMSDRLTYVKTFGNWIKSENFYSCLEEIKDFINRKETYYAKKTIEDNNKSVFNDFV